MLKGGVLVLLLIGSIKLLPKLNCIAPCGCDFIMFNPLAVWQGGGNTSERKPCAYYCACGTYTVLSCETCGMYTCEDHAIQMPHSTKIDYTQCINCSQRHGPLYCHQCVVCSQWIPLAITGGGWLPPLRRTIITRCAVCAHWVCGYCGNFTVGSEQQAGEHVWFATRARACGRPCTSLVQRGNFKMPQTKLKDWNTRNFGSTRQNLHSTTRKDTHHHVVKPAITSVQSGVEGSSDDCRDFSHSSWVRQGPETGEYASRFLHSVGSTGG